MLKYYFQKMVQYSLSLAKYHLNKKVVNNAACLAAVNFTIIYAVK